MANGIDRGNDHISLSDSMSFDFNNRDLSLPWNPVARVDVHVEIDNRHVGDLWQVNGRHAAHKVSETRSKFQLGITRKTPDCREHQALGDIALQLFGTHGEVGVLAVILDDIADTLVEQRE